MSQETHPEWITEAALADALKMPRHGLRPHRPDAKSRELKKNGATIVWSLKAAERVAAALGIAWSPSAPPEPDPTEDLMVIRPVPNPTILICKRHTGEEVCVRVPNNRRYTTRTGDGRFVLVRGRRSPSGNWWELSGRQPSPTKTPW